MAEFSENRHILNLINMSCKVGHFWNTIETLLNMMIAKSSDS